MKAMILAAGRGDRMRPLTDTTPKPLLAVRGKPLIQWHIEGLRDAGFDEIVVNASWLKEKLCDFLGDGARFGVRISISEEAPAPLETAGGIVQALPLLGERFVVVNGDVFTDFDFGVLRDLPAGDDLAHLVLVRNPDHHPQGDFALSGGRVSVDGDETSTFAGIGAYCREIFESLSPGARPLAPLLRDAMRAGRVGGMLHEGAWSDVGTPARLAQLDAE